MDNYDLLQELQHKTQQLETSIRLLRQNGTAYAEAERNYKILLRQVPLRHDLHPNGVLANQKYAKQIDLHLKHMAQRYFEEYYGDREEFMRLFGRSYL